MLVLGRKPNEQLVIDERIVITVVRVNGNQVRLGIEAPHDVRIQRQELLRPLADAEDQSLCGSLPR